MKQLPLFVVTLFLFFPLLADQPAQRSKKLATLSRVIFNNDGNEVFDPSVRTVEDFINKRNRGLLGSKVGVLSFNIGGAGFGNCSIPSQVWSPMYSHSKAGLVIRAMDALRTDLLAETIRFGRQNSLDVFFSIRMNDCHDAYAADITNPDSLFTPFKEAHPELLFGSQTNKPPYGLWSGVDFASALVRQSMIDFCAEICDNYEVDGMDLDFCRHWCFFRSAAWGETPTKAEIDALTAMMTEIRANADKAARRRNRPILIMVRVIDSVEACLAAGIDIERWCRDGLLDIVAGGSEIRANPPEYWRDFAARFVNVKGYLTITEAQTKGQHPLIARNVNKLNGRGQAALALESAVDGIYVFNEYYPQVPHSRWLEEADDAELLSRQNKMYYFSHSYYDISSHGKDWEQFNRQTGPIPRAPVSISRNKEKVFSLRTGKEAAGGVCKLYIHGRGLGAEGPLVTFNGDILGSPQMLEGLYVYDVPRAALKTGKNDVAFKLRQAEASLMLARGDKMLINEQQTAWRRLFSNAYKHGHSETIVDNSIQLLDHSSTSFFNLTYPWNMSPDDDWELRFQAQVIDSSDDDAVVLRVSDGRHAEVLQLSLEGVAFKYAGKRAKCDDMGLMGEYRLSKENGEIIAWRGAVEILRAPFDQTYEMDLESILSEANERSSFLTSNCLLIGSISPRGTGTFRFRELQLLTHGQIFDGALLIIHQDDEPETARLVSSPPMRESFAKLQPQAIGLLNAETYKQWSLLSINERNLELVNGKLILRPSVGNGPILRLPMTNDMQGKFSIRLRYRLLDMNTAAPQLHLIPVFSNGQGGYALWTFLFGNGFVQFNEEPPVLDLPKAGEPGEVELYLNTKLRMAELYVANAEKPTLAKPALNISEWPYGATISLGKGTARVDGELELIEAKIWQYK